MLKAAEYESRGSTMTFCEEDMPYYRRRIMLEINSRRLLDGSSAEVPDGAFEDALTMEEPDEQPEELAKQPEQLAQQLQEAESHEQEKENAKVSRQVVMQAELEEELDNALQWGRTEQVEFLLGILDPYAPPINWEKELQELIERMAKEEPEYTVHDEKGDGSCYFYAEQRALQHLGFATKTNDRNFGKAALAEKSKTLEEVRKRAGDKLDDGSTLAQAIALTQPAPHGGLVDTDDDTAVQAALEKCVYAFTSPLPSPLHRQPSPLCTSLLWQVLT